ncbi:hypothetical protein LAD64_23680 [Klebsiella pneumoniae]|nr:hypothetical protein [Klebsiella pneumoniae]
MTVARDERFGRWRQYRWQHYSSDQLGRAMIATPEGGPTFRERRRGPEPRTVKVTLLIKRGIEVGSYLSLGTK